MLTDFGRHKMVTLYLRGKKNNKQTNKMIHHLQKTAHKKIQNPRIKCGMQLLETRLCACEYRLIMAISSYKAIKC